MREIYIYIQIPWKRFIMLSKLSSLLSMYKARKEQSVLRGTKMLDKIIEIVDEQK